MLIVVLSYFKNIDDFNSLSKQGFDIDKKDWDELMRHKTNERLFSENLSGDESR